MARLTLNDSPKFRLLVRRLGIPRPHVRGYLESMWDCANATGEPLIGDAEQVEAAAEWPGEPGVLFAALTVPGRSWLDETEPGQWEVHDYFDHAPDYVRDRGRREAARREKGQTISSLRAEAGRKGGFAKAGKRVANAGNLPDTPGKEVANARTPAPAPAPAPAHSEPDVSPAPPATTTPTGKPRRKKGGKPDAEIPGELLAAIPEFPALWTRRLDAAGEKNRRPGPTGQEEQLELLRAGLATRGAADVVALTKMATSRSWQGMEWAWMDRDKGSNGHASPSRPHYGKPDPKHLFLRPAEEGEDDAVAR